MNDSFLNLPIDKREEILNAAMWSEPQKLDNQLMEVHFYYDKAYKKE